jgi:hypothetical protein
MVAISLHRSLTGNSDHSAISQVKFESVTRFMSLYKIGDTPITVQGISPITANCKYNFILFQKLFSVLIYAHKGL